MSKTRIKSSWDRSNPVHRRILAMENPHLPTNSDFSEEQINETLCENGHPYTADDFIVDTINLILIIGD